MVIFFFSKYQFNGNIQIDFFFSISFLGIQNTCLFIIPINLIFIFIFGCDPFGLSNLLFYLIFFYLFVYNFMV